jgi:hypothetical protein
MANTRNPEGFTGLYHDRQWMHPPILIPTGFPSPEKRVILHHRNHRAGSVPGTPVSVMPVTVAEEKKDYPVSVETGMNGGSHPKHEKRKTGDFF